MTADAGVLILDKPNAAQMNEDLMQAFTEAIQMNPAVDLLSVVGRAYIRAHRVVQYRELSDAGRLNLQTTNDLLDAVISSPDINLRDRFPSDYDRRYRWAKPKPVIPEPPAPVKPRDWFKERLDNIPSASIVYPLSEQASTLLQIHSKSKDYSSGEDLATSLKSLILSSERVFDNIIRGAVVKANDDIAIKVFPDNRDLTEYHNLQYLVRHAPDLPVPRVHGLIMLGHYRIMFMSYIHGATMDKVWSSISHEGKVSLKEQLGNIFSKLRCLRQDDGQELGGLGGEGVKDYRIMEVFAYKGITTAKAFNDLQFSAKHRASPCYAKLLHSFLEVPNKSLRGAVFTHGDLKKSNIIVKQSPGDPDRYTITGIIDWEDSGFYPEYYESTTISNGQSILNDDDWYLYMPDCLSPLQFPIYWLVDRLWGNLLWNWRTDIVR
ncbi:APH domain-containing protein [Trichophyton interdigitale]|nr:APH domain-containing protein [Trichophyton interdigitale]